MDTGWDVIWTHILKAEFLKFVRRRHFKNILSHMYYLFSVLCQGRVDGCLTMGMWRSKDNLWQLVPSFHHYGPGVWTKVIKHSQQGPLSAESSCHPKQKDLSTRNSGLLLRKIKEIYLQHNCDGLLCTVNWIKLQSLEYSWVYW